MDTAAPASIGALAFVVFLSGLTITGAPFDSFSVVAWIVAIPSYTVVAAVVAAWPDRSLLAVCASVVWTIALLLFLFLGALGADVRGAFHFPWPLLVIPLAIIPIAGLIGVGIGEYLRQRRRCRV